MGRGSRRFDLASVKAIVVGRRRALDTLASDLRENPVPDVASDHRRPPGVHWIDGVLV